VLYRLYFYLQSGSIPRFSDFKAIGTIDNFNQMPVNFGILPRACVWNWNVVRFALHKMLQLFDVWLTVHRSSMCNKKPTRCHLVLYLFLLISCSTCFGPPCAHLQEHYTTREKIPLSRQVLKMGTRWPETCWATYKEQLVRRNKYNTKWHLVGFLFHIATVVLRFYTFSTYVV